MSYQALYRAYRPNTFEKVVGQEAVVKTLQNAIINNKISHAYLFCGPRGTGKTSLARIFAKALNCAHVGKNGEPCCECDNCREITDSVSPDVVEIDAASNNGVDEIRDIRERVKFLPSGAKYKIYIIDEVHMLSTGAFNALLKILEEPPKYVIFILATTEPQKLPATIISRCQRYEFKPFNVSEISNNLKEICEKENVTISDEAAQLISEVADGGMRDALSILDQTISYGNKEITIDDVNTITGSINGEIMCNLMSYIDSRDTNNALNIINDLIKEGKEVNKIVNGMLLYCRDLMLYKSVGPKQLNKYIYEKEKFQTLALKIANTKIIYFIELLCDIQNRIKYTNSPAIYLEIAVIRMSSINNEELDVIKRMDELETKIIDANFSSEGNVSNVDNEKLNSLDSRLNKIIEELSKFELPNLSKKVNDIEQIVADKINQDLVNSSKQNEMQKLTELQSTFSSKFIEIEAKINALETGKVISNDNQNNLENINLVSNQEVEKIKLEITKLKNIISENNTKDFEEEINALKNQINTVIPDQSFDKNVLSNFEDKIDGLEKRLNEIQSNINQNKLIENNNANNDEEIKSIKTNVEKISSKIKDLESVVDEINLSENNQENISDSESTSKIEILEEKIQNLEKELYELVADNLANKDKEKNEKAKQIKKPSGQTNIFDFGVPAIEETNADFGDLEQESIQEEIHENIEVEQQVEVQDIITDNSSENSEEEIIEEVHQNNETLFDVSEDNLNEDIKLNESKETSEIVNENNAIETQEEKQKSLFDFNTDDEEISSNIQEEQKEESLEENNNIKLGLFDDSIYEEKESNSINNIIENANKENSESSVQIQQDNNIEFKPIKNEIINQYYDEENHVEVINKTNSSIVIRSENATEENVEEKQKEIIVLDEPDGPDKFAKYDIKDLENLLYDAQEINAKNDKARVLGIWANLQRGIDPSMFSIAELLSEAKVEAVGNRELVITYENVSKCNEVMRWSFKEQALKLLYAKLGGTYNYLALPLNIWKDKRREYIEQYQMGTKRAKLTPICIKGLNCNENNDEDVNDNKIDQTLKMFGEDIVKVK